MMPREITPSLAFVINRRSQNAFICSYIKKSDIYFTTCVSPFDISKLATKHNSPPAQEHEVRTRRQLNLPGCLLCGDFRVVNCVQKSAQSNMMPTDITGDQKRMFKTDMKYDDMWCH